jgi:hypothetical protein
VKFGQLDINPAENPGVLDTGTWDASAACMQVRTSNFDWSGAASALRKGLRPPLANSIQAWGGSASVSKDAVWFLAGLLDGQTVLICLGGPEANSALARPLDEWPLANEGRLTVYATTAAELDRYCRLLKPEKAPRALGAIPRLGVGTRMTTQVWPGIFEAMVHRGMAANSIQNSVRELSLLDDLLAARPPETNYSTGIGQIETGWTGSTYEGLWVAGVLEALKCEHKLCYGADADHVQVKRGPAGVERAKRVIRAARYYSFYTLDMADVLNYAALNGNSMGQAAPFLAHKIPDMTEQREVIEYHTRPFTCAGQTYRLDRGAVGGFVGKYWDALDAVGELAAYIALLKEGVAFDLELTIDEHPSEVAAFDCLTTDEEVLFLAREIKRRGLPITHVAPNFGQEKGYDYRCPDGLAGLEVRASAQFKIASEFGLMLDVHSGDDLSQEARRVFGRSSGGRLHFKVSPMLQLLYAETLQEFHPELFKRWWDDALAYAQREAIDGSLIARECLSELDSIADARPSFNRKVFRYFSFPFVGRRDSRGQFLNRADFYRLSTPFADAYKERVDRCLCELADDLF